MLTAISSMPAAIEEAASFWVVAVVARTPAVFESVEAVCSTSRASVRSSVIRVRMFRAVASMLAATTWSSLRVPALPAVQLTRAVRSPEPI